MSEYHVSSFIVRCHQTQLDNVMQHISQINGAQVHDFEINGKIIVTAEGQSHRFISDITEQIRDMDHVVDVAAVYHEYTSDSNIEGLTQ